MEKTRTTTHITFKREKLLKSIVSDLVSELEDRITSDPRAQGWDVQTIRAIHPHGGPAAYSAFLEAAQRAGHDAGRSIEDANVDYR